MLAGGDGERGDRDGDRHCVHRLLRLHLVGSLPLDCPRGDYRGKGRAGSHHWPTSVLWVFMRRSRHVHVVGEQWCCRGIGWCDILGLWRGEDKLFTDCLVGWLVDLKGNVDLCVVELLLMVILLSICRSCPPQVLLPHVRLNVVAQLLPHLASWPGALVDRLHVFSLQIHLIIEC